MIEFFVEGKPIPQGSMKYIGKGRMIHSRQAELALWRALIAQKAKQVGIWATEEPVKLHLTFHLKKPKSVKREYPTVPPDVDKLIRAVLDSLTNFVYLDDSQVISVFGEKIYSDTPGVKIKIFD
jgi:crossover junction endodeoxyribonuclease RusA